MSLRAMLLAAGRGERMRPLTDSTPKPLLKVQGKALIQWHIERLVAAQITEIVVNHAWLGTQIEDYLGDGSNWGAQIRYSAESSALETAGGIKQALPLLGSNPFLVISADVWSDWNPQLAFYLAQHLAAQSATAHLVLVPNPPHHPQGDFSLTAGRLQHHTSNQSYTYSGIGVFDPKFFNTVSAHTPMPLREPLHHAMAQGHVLGSVYTGTWMDIGTPERLKQIEQNLAAKA